MGESWQHDRRSRHERGYGAQWVKNRAVVLKRDGYRCRCEDCQRPGAPIKQATEVDHIVSKAVWLKKHGNLDGCDALSNLQAINHDCHQAKSLREKGYTQARRIGPDGWPIE